MIQLGFRVYQEKLKNDKLNYRPTEHYYEDSERFILFFKSRETWDYYTIVDKIDIIDFNDEIDGEYSIDFFRINYCSNNLEIEDAILLGVPIKANKTLPEDDDDDVDDTNMSVSKPTAILEPKTFLGNPPVNPPQIDKDLVIDAGEDIIEEAKDYGEFLTKLFDNMEKKVLSAVDKIGLEKSYLNKGFGEFIKNLFNVVNTSIFAKHIKKYIKADLITGMVSAEEELNVDIGFNDAYQQKLNVLSQQQLNGYKTPSGKKWAGIKGTTKTIQSKIIMTVQSGVAEHKTITQIKEDIKQDFSGFTDWRAQLISRTESNRVISQSKLLGYKESGLEGGKIVKVAMDNRTSPICRRLHAKYGDNPIPLDDPFIDDETMQEFMSPPFHIQCRTTLAFRTK